MCQKENIRVGGRMDAFISAYLKIRHIRKFLVVFSGKLMLSLKEIVKKELFKYIQIFMFEFSGPQIDLRTQEDLLRI